MTPLRYLAAIAGCASGPGVAELLILLGGNSYLRDNSDLTAID